MSGEPAGGRRPEAVRRVADIDWSSWKPTERATLLFVITGGRVDGSAVPEVLLIDKKTGLGAGKVNGPGGRIEPGESDLAAAVREVREELAVVPEGVTRRGELSFQFVDGYGLQAVVFTATGLRGTPTESREARPRWCRLHAVPYDLMWADDRLWFPLMLAGGSFEGEFVFDGDAMLDWRVLAVGPAAHVAPGGRSL